jgi:type IV pilus assembly protein PilF
MHRSMKRGLWIALLCIGLGLGSGGCATASARRESEHNARKAASRVEVGSDYLSHGQSALALREFLAAERLDPENAKVHYALGDAYLARGKRDEAERHLRRALEIFPDYHDARLFLSALLLMEKEYAEAAEQCKTLIDDPTYEAPWRALTNRGWGLFKLGRTEEARLAFDQAREYRHQYWPATLALAILEAETGKRLEAIRLYREIIAQGPGANVESEVNYRLGEIYVALGKRREAMGHLTTAVARAPDSTWAKKSQEYLKILH